MPVLVQASKGEGGSAVADPSSSDVLLCGLRGRLRLEAERERSYLVAGDRVEVADLGGGQGLIMKRLPRQSHYSRKAVDPANRKRGGDEQVVVANLDLLVVVMAATERDFRPARLDRFLLAAKRNGLPALAVVNKVDVWDPAARANGEAELAPQGASGVELHWTSALEGEGIDALRRRLAGMTSAFAGSSGVGKSTLIQALDPALVRRTQTLYEKAGTGRHTTTAVEVLPFGRGGYLVDTPGVKAFAAFDTVQADVLAAFPDIAELAAGCRFRDCAHEHEPGCDVRRALEDGSLKEERFRSYQKLLREAEGT